jgi:hypothetical protein
LLSWVSLQLLRVLKPRRDVAMHRIGPDSSLLAIACSCGQHQGEATRPAEQQVEPKIIALPAKLDLDTPLPPPPPKHLPYKEPAKQCPALDLPEHAWALLEEIGVQSPEPRAMPLQGDAPVRQAPLLLVPCPLLISLRRRSGCLNHLSPFATATPLRLGSG